MSMPNLIEFKLHGRRALATGSASGIGLATAERLARSGAHVAMNDLPTDALTRAVRDFKARGFQVEALPGDLSVSVSACAVGLRTLELLARDMSRAKSFRSREARAFDRRNDEDRIAMTSPGQVDRQCGIAALAAGRV